MSGPLTIVGLGPGRPELRTLAAQKAIDDASTIILRTRIHPGLRDLQGDVRVTTCDDLYDSGESFEATYAAIVERVTQAVAGGPVVFAVPGHPLFGETAAFRLMAWAASNDVPVTVVDGVSALDAIATALTVDPFARQVQLLDGAAIASLLASTWPGSGDIAIDPRRPCLVTQVYDRHIASSTKIVLSRIYPDSHPIAVVQGAGSGATPEVNNCLLYELDRVDIDHLSSVWIDAQPQLGAARSPFTLQSIINRLRSPTGCPWDRAQTHQTLRGAMIEEAYEVVDSIDEGDPDHLAEELGDVILQAFLHAQIADERGDFSIEDIWEQLNRKLVRRHPHVFGNVEASSIDDVRATWDNVKAQEPGRTALDDSQLGLLRRLPRSMPAMTRALMLLAPTGNSPRGAPSNTRDSGMGDALLTLLVKATDQGIDVEAALGDALQRTCAAGTLHHYTELEG